MDVISLAPVVAKLKIPWTPAGSTVRSPAAVAWVALVELCSTNPVSAPAAPKSIARSSCATTLVLVRARLTISRAMMRREAGVSFIFIVFLS